MIDLVLAQRVVDLLDDLIKRDPVAMRKLLASRVECNSEIANHPTVQCADGYYGTEVGMIGVLNGLCGLLEDGWGAVAVLYENDVPVGAKLLTVEDRKS